MPQLSLYLNEKEMRDLRTQATREGVSLSHYARNVLNKNNETNSWSKSFLCTFGAIEDESFTVPNEIPWELDSKRLEF